MKEPIKIGEWNGCYIFKTNYPSGGDLAIFLDLASRANMGGIQEWLSFYFKAPQTPTKDMQPLHGRGRRNENRLLRNQREQIPCV